MLLFVYGPADSANPTSHTTRSNKRKRGDFLYDRGLRSDGCGIVRVGHDMNEFVLEC